jgi:hypothetical protein
VKKRSVHPSQSSEPAPRVSEGTRTGPVKISGDFPFY